MKKNEFAEFNREKKTGNVIVIVIAIAAFCISGALYAAKLQQDGKYIILETGDSGLNQTSENTQIL